MIKKKIFNKFKDKTSFWISEISGNLENKKFKYFLAWSFLVFLAHNIISNRLVEQKDIAFFYIAFAIFLISLYFILFSFFKVFFIFRDEVVLIVVRCWLLPLILVLFLTLFINIDIVSGLSMKKLQYIFSSFVDISKLILLLLSLFIIVASFGKKIISLFRINFYSSIDCFLIAIGIGMGFFSYLIYFVCLEKIAYPLTIIIILIIFGTISYKEIIKYITAIFKNKFEVRISSDKSLEIFGTILILMLFCILLVYSLANILSGEWDTFHQYLTFPAAYAENHGLVYFKYHPHWGFPQSGEMIFLAGILLGNIKLAFILHYSFLILSILTLCQIFKKFGRKNLIWIFFISASIPIILIWLSGYLKIESILFFYVALIYLVLYYIYAKTRETKYYFIFSFFCGMAIAVKYTAILLVLSLAASFLFFRHKINLNLKKVIIFTAIVACLYFPWGIKNWLYYNNAFYPILSGNDFFFQNLGIQCNSYFLNYCKEDVFEAYGNNLLKSPSSILSNVLLLFRYLIFYSGLSIADPGPWFLVFIPLLIFYYFKINNSFLRTIYFSSFIYLLFWVIFFAGQIWYLIPFFFGFLIILAYIFENYFDIGKNIFFKTGIIIWLFWILYFWIINGNYSEKIAYFKKENNLEQSYELIKSREKNYKKLDWFRMWKYININILSEKSSKVVYGYYDTQGYFIKDSYRNFIPDFYGYLFACLSKNNLAYDRLKKINVGYFVVDEEVYSQLDKNDEEKFLIHKSTKMFKEFIEKHGEIVHTENSIILYSLK
jgi:hypothetical protein